MAGSTEDQWFDPWLVPVGEAINTLADDLHALLLANETGRVRRRDKSALEAFRAALRALLANLAVASLAHPEGRALALSLANPRSAGLGRYGHPIITAGILRDVVRQLEANALVHVTTGRLGRATTLTPTLDLLAELTRRGVTLPDGTWATDDASEVIILSRKVDGWTDAAPITRTENLPYADTPETLALRQQVRALNTRLAQADVVFADDGKAPRVDTRQRRLRRHFKQPPSASAPSFTQGGRLFGGFWLNLARPRRRASLRIDGEAIAECDFSALFVRLAYAELGLRLPVGLEADPYAIAGFPPEHRGGLKRLANALFFVDKPLKRAPPDIAPAMPPGWTAGRVTDCFLVSHPALSGVIHQQSGFRFMKLESDILLRVLDKLGAEGITGLPLHDAVLVARSKADIAKRIMEEEGQRLAGVLLPVSIKLGE
jgi:hypothetical protein